MKEDITIEQADAILKALDDALQQGPWEDSNFLRGIGKNLQKIRDDFAGEMQRSQETEKEMTSSQPPPIKTVNQQEVYISLYTMDGNYVSAWERVIANLPRQVVSRSIYAEEEDIKNLLRSKDNKVNEAYVAIYVNPSDILPVSSDKTLKDKFGKPLLMIKDKAISLNNLSRFVHSTGTYTLEKGRLVKNSSAEN